MNPDIRIVAFKLTDGADDANRDSEVKRLAERACPDLIVHNDIAAISGNHHPATIYSVGDAGRVVSVVARAASGAEIGKELEALL